MHPTKTYTLKNLHQNLMAEDLGEEDIVGDILGFELVATDGAVEYRVGINSMAEQSETVREKIERLQAWAHELEGRNPEHIPADLQYLRDKRPRPFWDNPAPHEIHAALDKFEIETDEELRRHRETTYSKWSTTKYQDPIILGAIAFPWKDVVSAAKSLPSEQIGRLEDPESHRTRVYIETKPLLATIPVKVLNGFALRDTFGSYGIVLQEGFRFFPTSLAIVLGHVLFQPQGTRFSICFDMERVETGCLTEWANQLIGLFLSDAVSPYGLCPSRAEYERATEHEELKKLQFLIEYGFNFFVLAHEYAHCISGHFDMLLKPDTCFFVRSTEELKAAWEHYYDEYEHLQEPDAEQKWAFFATHSLEFDADRTALLMLLEHIRHRDERCSRGEGMLLLLGAFLFFWYAEFTERVQRTFELSDQWFDNPLYFTDWLVQDLLYRGTHPAPLERLWRSAHVIREFCASDEELFRFMFEPLKWLGNFFNLAWTGNREWLATTIRNADVGINPIWASVMPEVGLSIGMVRQRR